MATIPQLEAKYFPPGLPPGVPNWHDTLVVPHVDGDAYFAAIADALEACAGPGDRIYITSWAFDPTVTLRSSPGSKSLELILLEKARLGADVRVIVAAPRFSYGLDGLSPWDPEFWLAFPLVIIGEDLVSIVRKNIRAVRALRAEGKPFLNSKILLDWGGRNDSRHEKVTIIYNSALDELRAFVGGIDYQSDRKSDERHTNNWWHDAGLELLGGAAAAVTANFADRWHETVTLPAQRCMLDGRIEEFNPLIVIAPPWQPAGPQKPLPPTSGHGQYLGASVRSIRSYDMIRAMNPWLDDPYIQWQRLPPLGVRETLDLLTKAIAAAERYVYIEDQTINGSSLEEKYAGHTLIYPVIRALLQSTSRAKVIFVTSGFNGPGGRPALTTLSPETERRILSPLSNTQREKFAAFYARGTKVHSKLVLIDDEFALVGSANMWDRSMLGTENEVGVALVHTGAQSSLVADLRVRLWTGHLRVATEPPIESQLRDLGQSLGIFRSSWGSGVSFPYPRNSLSEILP